MEGILLLISGAGFFTSSFVLLRKVFTFFLKDSLTVADITTITVKCVSSIQAVLSIIVGCILINSCGNDIMHDSHWIANAYAWFGIPYFYYDMCAMYIEHLHFHAHIQDKGMLFTIKHYLTSQKMLFVHHVVLPTFIFPVIIFLRRGLGDFFVGVFYTIELAVPFLAARNVLVQLKMKDTALYLVVGIVMIVVFFISRILVFPYMYWKYAVYAKVEMWRVPVLIPVKCNIGCLGIMFFQSIWLWKMMKGAFKLIRNISSKTK